MICRNITVTLRVVRLYFSKPLNKWLKSDYDVHDPGWYTLSIPGRLNFFHLDIRNRLLDGVRGLDIIKRCYFLLKPSPFKGIRYSWQMSSLQTSMKLTSKEYYLLSTFTLMTSISICCTLWIKETQNNSSSFQLPLDIYVCVSSVCR